VILLSEQRVVAPERDVDHIRTALARRGHLSSCPKVQRRECVGYTMATNTAGRMCSTLLVALVVLSALEGDADAFCRRRTCGSRCELDSEQCPVGGEPLRWPSSTLSFALHSNIGEVKGRPAEVYAAIRTAIHVWSDTECPLSGGGTARTSLRFRELEREEFAINAISSKSDAYKLRNVILFRSGGWPYAGRDDESEVDTIASARARFDSKTGLVRSQQIELNEAGYEFRLPDQAFAQSASERCTRRQRRLLQRRG
jgi:hypothetical protein